MPLNDYVVGKWEHGSSDHAVAQKGKTRYQLKRYCGVPYPAGEDLSQPWARDMARNCEALLKVRQGMNSVLKKASGRERCLAYAEEVFLNKNSDAPGVIEAVPYVEGARDVAYLRENKERLLSGMESSANALAKLHACGIVHADIKPDNILYVPKMMGRSVNAIIIDFDASYRVSRPPIPDATGGSEGYIAPEVIAYANDEECEMDDGSDSVYRKKLTEARDIYSLGSVFCFMLTGRAPEMSDSGARYDHSAVDRTLHTDYFCDLLDAMLAWEPTERPSAEAVAESIRQGKLCFSVEAFEELWPEHAANYAYAPNLDKRYKRVRRAGVRGDHEYVVTFPTGDTNNYTIQMLLNTGALQPLARSRHSERVERPTEKSFMLKGVKFEEGLLWPEDGDYEYIPEEVARWGYQAIYRISKGEQHGYVGFKAEEGFQKITFIEMKFQKMIKTK